MRKSLKLILALALSIAPTVTEAIPVASVQSQITAAQPLVQKVYYVRRRAVVVRRGPGYRGAVVRRSVVVRRPYAYRPWVRRPYYGTVVAGVALGTVIAVAAATAPRAPSSSVCWYWSNNVQTRGYWDYCRK